MKSPPQWVSEGMDNELAVLRYQVCEIKTMMWATRRSSDASKWFLECNSLFNVSGHFHAHYDEWRMRRIRKVLELYEDDLKGKRILEVGGGLGDIGACFAEFGAEVLSLEGRRVNHRVALLRFKELKNFTPVLFDVEQDFTHFGRFDLILNFGLLEVVSNVDHVMDCCARMSDAIFVDTLVCDSLDDQVIYSPSMSHDNDAPLHSVEALPSPIHVEKCFEAKGFRTHRAFDKDLNSALTNYHFYDWKHGDTEGVEHLRRFWYFRRG